MLTLPQDKWSGRVQQTLVVKLHSRMIVHETSEARSWTVLSDLHHSHCSSCWCLHNNKDYRWESTCAKTLSTLSRKSGFCERNISFLDILLSYPTSSPSLCCNIHSYVLATSTIGLNQTWYNQTMFTDVFLYMCQAKIQSSNCLQTIWTNWMSMIN